MRLPSSNNQAGFSLIETTVAAAIAAMFLTSLFTMNIATMDTIRAAKESIAASQILQQRMESMRIANWHQVTDAAWLKTNLMGVPVAGSAPLKGLVETLIVIPYGSPGVGTTQLQRSGGTATIVSQNPALLAENAVKILWTVNYTGSPNSQNVTRQIVAVLAKGGVAK